MDKSWMYVDRRSKAYELGVEGFLRFALENVENREQFHCPCAKCGNILQFGVGIIRDHLYFNGVNQSYHIWVMHEESNQTITNASRDAEASPEGRYSFVYEEIGMKENDLEDIRSDPYEFSNVIGDSDQPLDPGCSKYTKLSALIKVYNLKAKYGMSDFMMLTLLISGSKQPNNDIDVYLDPLIHVKYLWDGICGVYDAHK
ncbi:unnamed protein product, partial [Prunus brigantina]